MKKYNLIEELNELIIQRAKKSGKSLGSYYKRIFDYCKKRIEENKKG